MSAQERCRAIVETEILKQGYGILGWRQVPVDVSVIGEKANQTRPEIEQVLIGARGDVDEDQFEVDLYTIRRRVEKAVLSEAIKDFYICSMSCRSIIYKGMFLAEQVDIFYRICVTSGSFRTSASIISVIRPTPSRAGRWRSRSVFWPITARSTRCAVTSTG